MNCQKLINIEFSKVSRYPFEMCINIIVVKIRSLLRRDDAVCTQYVHFVQRLYRRTIMKQLFLPLCQHFVHHQVSRVLFRQTFQWDFRTQRTYCAVQLKFSIRHVNFRASTVDKQQTHRYPTPHLLRNHGFGKIVCKLQRQRNVQQVYFFVSQRDRLLKSEFII